MIVSVGHKGAIFTCQGTFQTWLHMINTFLHHSYSLPSSLSLRSSITLEQITHGLFQFWSQQKASVTAPARCGLMTFMSVRSNMLWWVQIALLWRFILPCFAMDWLFHAQMIEHSQRAIKLWQWIVAVDGCFEHLGFERFCMTAI